MANNLQWKAVIFIAAATRGERYLVIPAGEFSVYRNPGARSLALNGSRVRKSFPAREQTYTFVSGSADECNLNVQQLPVKAFDTFRDCSPFGVGTIEVLRCCEEIYLSIVYVRV